MATLCHYLVYIGCYKLLGIESAGLSNFLASTVGITVSFLGNRYFVFRAINTSIGIQFTRFAFLYALIALLHGSILLIWTDYFGFNHNLGFVIAVIVQTVVGFIVGARYVFK